MDRNKPVRTRSPCCPGLLLPVPVGESLLPAVYQKSHDLSIHSKKKFNNKNVFQNLFQKKWSKLQDLTVN